MKSAKELLEELNTLDEHTTIEAKTSAEMGTSLLETVCAFANEPKLGGGNILCGVSAVENSYWPDYTAKGVENSDQLRNDIASQCATMFNVPTGKALDNWPPTKTQELESKKQELGGKKQELDTKTQELSAEKQEFSSELAERIAAQGKKGSKEEILNLVFEMLFAKEMSAAELAGWLGRTQDYVRRTYIKPLVEAGRVVSSNPESPTDPGLTYRVTEQPPKEAE